MKRIILATTVLALGWPVAASAGGFGLGPGPGLTGNDTGGIITWSPEHQRVARPWAADHCAHYRKAARITSIRARYGDYIAFECYFPRYHHRRINTVHALD
jgi:hypothetical protein